MSLPHAAVIDGPNIHRQTNAVPIDWPLWGGTLGLAIAVAIAIALANWSVAWTPLRPALGAELVLLALGVFYRQSRRSGPLARLCLSIAHSLALAYVFQASTYVVSTSAAPLRSAELTRADALMGFSWTAWTAWVHAHHFLWAYFEMVHPLHFAAMTLAVTVLALKTESGAIRLLRAFTFAFMVSLTALAVAPALTNTPNAWSNTLRLSLRDGTFRIVDFAHTAGLISFPSMHAAMAVLACVALWPFRAWRGPLIVFTVSLCVGAISEGGHYLVDILAGAPLGWIGWHIAQRSPLRP